MGTPQLSSLNTDTNGIETSGEYGDDGTGSSRWLIYTRSADGGHVSIGTKADAAVTDPTASGSLLALIKGLLTLRKREDDAHASLDPGIQMLGVRKDTAAATAGTDGDYMPLIFDSTGRLWVHSDVVTALHLEDAAAASGDAGFLGLGVRSDTLAATTSTDGDYAAPALGQAGEQFVTPSVSGAVANSAPSNTTTTAYAASLIVKASAGTIYGLSGYNSLASAQFIQIHNTTTVPADTAVPAVVILAPASSNFSIDFGIYGRRFATGITVCNSTTGPTKTIGAANCWIDAQFK